MDENKKLREIEERGLLIEATLASLKIATHALLEDQEKRIDRIENILEIGDYQRE